MFIPNHLHLLVKGYVKNPPQTENVLNEWFKQLVNNVGMKVVAGPTSIYVNEPGNEGITGTVTLATSHASIHVWDRQNPAMFQFDLYSCSDFTPTPVIQDPVPVAPIDTKTVTVETSTAVIDTATVLNDTSTALSFDGYDWSKFWIQFEAWFKIFFTTIWGVKP